MRSGPLRRLLARTPRRRSRKKAIDPQQARPNRAQVKAGYLFVVCLVVCVVAAAFVFHLHIRFEAIQLGYETSRARAERARLLVEQRELRLELASLKEPRRIEAEAREKLDMEIPDHQKIIPIGKQRRPLLASGGAL